MDYSINHTELFKRFKEAKLQTADDIKAYLSGLKYEDAEINNVIQEYKMFKNKCRTTNGIVCVSIGGFLAFTSMMLTFMGIFPNLRTLILVGMTSIGIMIGLLGMVLIFERVTLK